MTRILCLHGLGGTGATMWPVVAACSDAGFTAFAPTLPGHGGDPTDLLTVGWFDWCDAAKAWPADVIVGQSMGGSLALAVAATGACRAVVLINPPVPDVDALDGLEWMESRGHDWLDGPPLAAGEQGYSTLPIGALIEMTKGVQSIDHAAVTVPVLLVSSAHDDVVDPITADLIADAVSGTVTRLTLPNSGHVASLGPDIGRLAAAITRFVGALAH